MTPEQRKLIEDLLADEHNEMIVRQLWSEQYVAIRALLAERDELAAELGVLLNGAAMVARTALPYLEKMHADRPTHETGERVALAKGQIDRRTDETNQCAIKWMRKMTAERDALAAENQRLAERVRVLQVDAGMLDWIELCIRDGSHLSIFNDLIACCQNAHATFGPGPSIRTIIFNLMP